MDINNLTSVYNQNPTLQGQYTLQQYLDLFGQGSTPTSTPPTTTGDPNPTLIQPKQGIINANINQYQNQGGGGDGVGNNNTIGGKDYGYKSSFASTGTTPGENENFLNDIREGTIDDDDLSFGLSLKEGLYSLQNTFRNLPTPFNLAKKGMKAFNDYKEKKEIERQKEIERVKKEAEAKQAIADAEAIERIRQQYASQGRDYGQGAASQATQDSYAGSDGSYAGASTQDYGGGEKDGGYIDGTNRRKTNYFKGGSVRKYFKGGIVSLRRR